MISLRGLLVAQGNIFLEPHLDIQKSDNYDKIPVSVYYSLNSFKVTREGILELDLSFQGDNFPKIYAFSDLEVKKSVPREVNVYVSLVTRSSLGESRKKFTFYLPREITAESGCNINIIRKNPHQRNEWLARIVS